MSARLIAQLGSIRDEFTAARGSLEYVGRNWQQLVGEAEFVRSRFSHVREALRNLEATYSIRLFSEFEAILQEHLTTSRPGIRIPGIAEALINRVATHLRIPNEIRAAAQEVGEYRNSLVHRRVVAARPLGFREALTALNRFLALLPD